MWRTMAQRTQPREIRFCPSENMPEIQDWLNSFNPYRQYTHQIPAKAKELLDRYGWFFDDTYIYYKERTRDDIMLRLPQWMWPEKGSGRFCEKWRRASHEKQTRLPIRITHRKRWCRATCHGNDFHRLQEALRINIIWSSQTWTNETHNDFSRRIPRTQLQSPEEDKMREYQANAKPTLPVQACGRAWAWISICSCCRFSSFTRLDEEKYA